MLAMWTAMADMFGSAWVSQYGTSEEPAFGTWSQGLADYTPEQIQRGARNCADSQMWGRDFPPNLSQFGKLCLSEKRYTEPYHRPFDQKSLEHKPRKASKAAMERELERQRVLRETGELPDESFAESYEKLNLHLRWGPLPVERRNL